jgi:C4-dicarboxylate transporter DctM subunit
MGEYSMTLVLFGTLTAALLLGIPMGFSLGIAALVGLFFTKIPLIFMAETFFSGAEIFPLIAIPGFILAGNIMLKTGITEKIINVIHALAGHVPGGYAVVTIFSCMFFASLSGSGPATTAAIGSIMIPAMNKAGYELKYAAGVASSGGTLGILIPPSNPMIIYGVMANLSVAGLFMAGFLPGIILGGCLALQCLVYGKVKGYVASGETFSLKRLFKTIYDGALVLLMPVFVLGSIYGGFATATEASIVAVLYSIFLGLLYRKLTWKDFCEALIKAGELTGAVLVIMGPSMAFGKLLTMYEIPARVGQLIMAVSTDKNIVLLMISLFLLFVGTFMETLSTIVLLTPLFLPILKTIGCDPVHFGILFVVLSEVGFLTPPLGVNLYVASAISGLTLEEVSKGVIQFIILMCAVIVLFIYWPQICTYGYYLVGSR